MKLKAFLGTLAVAFGLGYSTARAEHPSGIALTGGWETLTETRPEVEGTTRISGVRASLDLNNLRKGDFSLDGEVGYRFLNKGLNGLETITGSVKPGYIVFERHSRNLDVEVAPGLSAVYHRTTGDSVELIPDIVGLSYSYGSAFAAPRVKASVDIGRMMYSEVATEVGAKFDGTNVKPYFGIDARHGIGVSGKHLGAYLGVFEEGRVWKGGHFADFGGEVRTRFHEKAPTLALRGFFHSEKNEYFTGKGGGFIAGLEL